MLIRPETPSDHAAIRTINIQAFAHHPFSRQTEHLIVQALRDANALVLSLVAEDAGAVIGHIAFSLAMIDGKDAGWYTLGPIAVLPDRQGQGVGSQLVNAGLAALRLLGANGCVLVGDPGFYARFGFRVCQSLTVDGVSAEYFQCLVFCGQEPSGVVTHHPAFAVTA